MSVKTIKSEKEFKTEVKQSAKPVVVLFTGTYCAPCQEFKPLFEKVAKRLSKQLEFVKIFVFDVPALEKHLPSNGIPHLALWDKGKRVFDCNPWFFPDAEAFENELRTAFGSAVPPLARSKAAHMERWKSALSPLPKDLLGAYCRKLKLVQEGKKDALVARLSHRMVQLSQKNAAATRGDFRKMVEAHKGKDALQKAASKLKLPLESGRLGDIADAMFAFASAETGIRE